MGIVMSGRATDLTWYCLFTIGDRLVGQDKKGSVRDSSDIKSRAFTTTNLQSISLIGNKTLVRWACPNVVYSAFPTFAFVCHSSSVIKDVTILMS
jgi:hypothetical protein